ncbi:MAG: hypothetical protein IIT37_11740, partial [Bacteroidales bacterium]|nr:hypothetical protein [Bacteroidales bacterium]
RRGEPPLRRGHLHRDPQEPGQLLRPGETCQNILRPGLRPQIGVVHDGREGQGAGGLKTLQLRLEHDTDNTKAWLWNRNNIRIKPDTSSTEYVASKH